MNVRNCLHTIHLGTGWSFQVYLFITSSLLEDSQFDMSFSPQWVESTNQCFYSTTYSALARNIIEKDNTNHFNLSKPWKQIGCIRKKTRKQHTTTFWISKTYTYYIYIYVCLFNGIIDLFSMFLYVLLLVCKLIRYPPNRLIFLT